MEKPPLIRKGKNKNQAKRMTNGIQFERDEFPIFGTF
jgi:hypothetical protein